MTIESSDYAPQAVALRLGEDRSSAGWTLFVAALLCTLGTLNVIDGIASIGNSQFFVRHAHYVFGDLGTWGWIQLGIGVFQLLTGLALFRGYDGARWVAAAFAIVNMWVQLLAMPAAPYWSLAVFALDVIVVYGLFVRWGPSLRPV
jgi:hypothetical protein